MAKLQEPKFVYMNGKLCPWREAVLHIGCEGVTRGLNVFEGIKGYWQVDGAFGLVQLRRHYDRLLRSARLLHIPCRWSYEEFKGAIFELLSSLVGPDRDMWIRTTLYVTEGHWGEGTVADLVLTAYHLDKALPEEINLGVSTWQRSGDISLPARIKTSTNYQVARLARIEGRARQCQDMVLLNQVGRVAEATGSCILMVRDNVVYTPPSSEGALESITVDLVEALAGSLGIKFVRRPIDRTELLIAEEVALCGTLSELVSVRFIEGLPLSGNSTLLTTLQEKFFEVVRGGDSHPSVEITILPGSQALTQ